MDTTRRVAILGTGRMGSAFCGTLRRAGFDVIVWNRTTAVSAEVATRFSTSMPNSIAEALIGAHVAITCLADDNAVRQVYATDGGIVTALEPGTVVLEMSTIAPATVRGLGPLVEARGAAMLDAPVSGSVAFAEQGRLTAIVGGDSGALEQARPVLDALCSRVLHVGELGSGATMKLSVNALVHALNVGVSEALVLAEKAGVPRRSAYDVLAASVGGAPYVHYKQAAFIEPDSVPVAFSLDLVRKDLDLILQLADQVGARMEQAAANRRTIHAAIDAGLGAADLSAVAVLLRNQTRP